MNDVINPGYYQRNGFDLNTAIIDWGLAFNPGCAVKYICRAGHKGEFLEDISKALKHMELWWEGLSSAKVKAPSVIDSDISPKLVIDLWEIKDMRLRACITQLSDCMRPACRTSGPMQVMTLLRKVLDDPRYAPSE